MAFTGNWTTNTFKTGLLNGTFDFTSGTFKIALYTNAADLDATTSTYTSSGEVVAGGYNAGGNVLTVTQVPTVGSGTTAYLSFGNTTWNASLTARGALIYLANGTTNPTVCVLDFGNDKTSSSVFTIQMPQNTATSALIRLT